MKPSDRLETILKSLDKLNQDVSNAAYSADGLQAKIALHGFVKVIHETRHTLRLHVFDAQDSDKLI